MARYMGFAPVSAHASCVNWGKQPPQAMLLLLCFLIWRMGIETIIIGFTWLHGSAR